MSQTTFNIIFFALVFGLIIFWYLKKRNCTWTGTLINKKIRTSTDEDGDTSESYKLIFKTDKGKTVKYTVLKPAFDKFTENVKYEKVKGQWLPKPIEENK